MFDETIVGFCRMCPASCGVRVTRDGSGARHLTGDRKHPVSAGYVCPKGRRMLELVDDPAVLNRPLMRDRRGELVPASWQAALDDLAEKLIRIVEEHEPYAVATYSGTGNDSTARYAESSFMR